MRSQLGDFQNNFPLKLGAPNPPIHPVFKKILKSENKFSRSFDEILAKEILIKIVSFVVYFDQL